MADPQKLDVLKRLTTLLEGVTFSYGGRSFALTGAVFRGRHQYGENDPDTMISILESPRSGGSIFGGYNEARSDEWTLLIQGWTSDDKRNPSDPLYWMLDAVERRLDRINRTSDRNGQPSYPEHYMLGNTVSRFQVNQGVVRPPTENLSSKSFFYLPVLVGIARIAD